MIAIGFLTGKGELGGYGPGHATPAGGSPLLLMCCDSWAGEAGRQREHIFRPYWYWGNQPIV